MPVTTIDVYTARVHRLSTYPDFVVLEVITDLYLPARVDGNAVYPFYQRERFPRSVYITTSLQAAWEYVGRKIKESR